MRPFLALLSGLLFGLGLTISGMIDPAKVLGFLDIAGNWDPSLAFVMAGAIPVAAVGFAIRRQPRPAAGAGLGVDRRLAIGAALFGAGWGLAGYCPGPALASLGFANWRTLLFVAAMLVGMTIFEITNRPSGDKVTAAADQAAQSPHTGHIPVQP